MPAGSLEVFGEGAEGEGKAADEDGVGDGGVGVRGGEGGAAEEFVVPNVVAVPRSYSDQAVNAMTADQAQAALASGTLTVPQMQRMLGGLPLTHKGLLIPVTSGFKSGPLGVGGLEFYTSWRAPLCGEQ